TRLLAELLTRAEQAGWQTMVGHCLSLGDSGLPYLPFSEIVGRLAATGAEVTQRVVASHPAISVRAPRRRRVSAAPKAPSDELDRAELFDAVHGLLDDHAQQGPLLVVIEDVHWADQSTRDLLSFLFARPFRGQVSLVASYRTDDLHRRHPLR